MTINIMCSDPTWIYGQFIEEFKKHSAFNIVVNAKKGFDLVHYLPYYEVPAEPFHPCTSWHSHQELTEPLKNKFVSSAQIVDYAISHSKKYADLLKGLGMTNIEQVMPGVDGSKYKQRAVRKDKRDRLVVGYIGRQYTSTNRKNPSLLQALGKLPFVELRSTGGKIVPDKMPAFYADLDVVVSPALIEGGPMAMLESQMVGVPFVCYDNVGTAGEFEAGIIKVPYNDEKAFTMELHKIWSNKRHEEWNTTKYMGMMRAQVADFTWRRFVDKHDIIWGKTLDAAR